MAADRAPGDTSCEPDPNVHFLRIARSTIDDVVRAMEAGRRFDCAALQKALGPAFRIMGAAMVAADTQQANRPQSSTGQSARNDGGRDSAAKKFR